DVDRARLFDGDRLLLFTSGSAGVPKGVPLTGRNVEAGLNAVVSTYGLGDGDVTASLLPWSHGHGLVGVLLASLSSGGRLIDGWWPAAGGDRSAATSPTWVSAVPPLLALLAEAAASAACTADGWYRTQDIGIVGLDGYVKLLGRRSEFINRGGYNISPVEVEEVVASYPAILSCLVAAVPHPVLGEEVGLLVMLRHGEAL